MLQRDSPDVKQILKHEVSPCDVWYERRLVCNTVHRLADLSAWKADALVGSMVADLFEGMKNGSWHPVLDEL
eukprot:3113024-Amphidinium_carterae.3